MISHSAVIGGLVLSVCLVVPSTARECQFRNGGHFLWPSGDLTSCVWSR